VDVCRGVPSINTEREEPRSVQCRDTTTGKLVELASGRLWRNTDNEDCRFERSEIGTNGEEVPVDTVDGDTLLKDYDLVLVDNYIFGAGRMMGRVFLKNLLPALPNPDPDSRPSGPIVALTTGHDFDPHDLVEIKSLAERKAQARSRLRWIVKDLEAPEALDRLLRRTVWEQPWSSVRAFGRHWLLVDDNARISVESRRKRASGTKKKSQSSVEDDYNEMITTLGSELGIETSRLNIQRCRDHWLELPKTFRDDLLGGVLVEARKAINGRLKPLALAWRGQAAAVLELARVVKAVQYVHVPNEEETNAYKKWVKLKNEEEKDSCPKMQPLWIWRWLKYINLTKEETIPDWLELIDTNNPQFVKELYTAWVGKSTSKANREVAKYLEAFGDSLDPNNFYDDVPRQVADAWCDLVEACSRVSRVRGRGTKSLPLRIVESDENPAWHTIWANYRNARPKPGSWPSSIVLVGETGTGKELLAHYCFVALWLALETRPNWVKVVGSEITNTLYQSQLAGHVAKAYTDAEDREGAASAAKDGVFFFDELQDACRAAQVFLLRFLDGKFEYKKLGENEIRHAPCFFLAASNRLDAGTRESGIAHDLFARLTAGGGPVVLPPLRSHPQRVSKLASFFVEQRLESEGCDVDGVSCSHGAATVLEGLAWKRNAREVRGVAERAAVEIDRKSVV